MAVDQSSRTLDALAPSTGTEVTKVARAFASPHVVLGAVVVVAFAVYAALAVATSAPRVFPDELIYFDAAGSLASGGGFEARGKPYGFALLYPVVLTPLLAAFDREVAYELAKCLNALFFALAAVPIYLVARRLLTPSASLAVATLSVAIPAAMYATVVMTESLAYLVFWFALLAIIRALERPTVTRQVIGVAVIVLACLARPQFVVLYGVLLLGLVGVVTPASLRRAPRAVLSRTWPTLACGAFGVAFIAARMLSNDSPSQSLGGYERVWRLYSPIDVGRYIAWELANFELYVGILPVVLVPLVVADLVRRTRRGERNTGAFLAVFLWSNVFLFVLVAAFDSIDFRYLHDRYLFYLAPLWVIALFMWLVRTEVKPRSAVALAFGAALLPVLVPLEHVRERPAHWAFHAPGTTIPKTVADAVGSDAISRVIVSVGVLALLVAVLRLRHRAGATVAPVLLAVFAINSAAAWSTAQDPPASKVFDAGADRSWIDHAITPRSSVVVLAIPCNGIAPTERVALDWYAFLTTEFFNASVGSAVQLDPADPDSARFGAQGHIVEGGKRLEAEYVLAQPGVRVLGRRVSEGTTARLVLWRVDGPVRVSGATSTEQLRDRVCRRGDSGDL